MFSFFLSRNRNLIVFIFLFLLSVSFMSFGSSKFSLSFKETGESILYPFRYLLIQVQAGAQGVASLFGGGKDDLKDKLKEQEKLLTKYRARLISLEEKASESVRLRKLLDYKQKPEYKLEVAEVIGRDPENNFSSLTINKGAFHGLKSGMAVFAYTKKGYFETKGIIGIISECAFFSSKIKTFRNEDFSIGIYLPDSKVHGIAKGIGDNKNLMNVLYIDKEVKVTAGDRVETSAQSKYFPKGFLVGFIYQKKQENNLKNLNDNSLTHKLYLKPFLLLSSVKDVLIIKDKVYAKKLNIKKEQHKK